MAHRTGPVTGEVVEFRDPEGWGTVRSESGDEHFFHCSAIADGTRTIEVGARVSYDVVPGHLGRWEASDLRPA
jgi:cold shock CspA family protein